MSWLPLTLLCAFSLASADALTKARLSDYSAQELTFVRLTLAGLITSPLLLNQPFPELPLKFWLWTISIVPLEIAAMVFYIKAIQGHPLSTTVPYLAFTPVFVSLTGRLLLDETVSTTGLIGILLVVSGAWLLNFRHARLGDWQTWASPLTSISRHPGSLMMLGVALLYSVTSVGGKGAMQYMAPEQFGPFYYSLVGILLIPMLGLARPEAIRRIGRKPLPVLGTGLLMGIMLLTHFIALQQVEVAYMIAVKRTSLLFGILYGALVFRETGLAGHLLAGTVIVAGVVLISLG